ncbi:hypothetical protein N9Z02_01935, partial [Akkermansiaceae bacterium]|nr:hypothetical protein [Akkermansiaceae bacterium]
AYELGKRPQEKGNAGFEQRESSRVISESYRGDMSDRDRTENLRRELESCVTVDDFRAALDQLQFRADKTEENRLLSVFFQYWLEVAPMDALTEVRRVEGLRHDIVRTSAVFETWAVEKPDDAIALLRQVLDGRQNETSALPPFLDGVDPPEYVLSLFSGLAKVDPQATARLLSEAEVSPVFPNALDVLLQNWFPENSVEVLEWSSSLEESSFKKEVISRIGGKAGQLDDPSGGIAWAQSLDSEADQALALRSITGQWAQRRSRDAFQWMSQLPESELKFSLAPLVISSLTKVDPGAAADWLNQYEASQQMDPSVAAYALSVSSANPAAGLGSASAITDPVERALVSEKIRSAWELRFPESYERYLNTVDDDESRSQ